MKMYQSKKAKFWLLFLLHAIQFSFHFFFLPNALHMQETGPVISEALTSECAEGNLA